MEIHILTPSEWSQLSDVQVGVFKDLVKKDFWDCLKGKDPWGVNGSEIYGAVVYEETKVPIGVALVTYREYISWAKLLALPVNLSENILILILEGLKEKLLQQNCKIISYVYSSNIPQVSILESLFAKLGWSLPRLFMVHYYFKRSQFNPDWIKHNQKMDLPKDCSLFPWSKLSSHEEYQLQSQLNNGSIPLSVSPFHEIDTIEPLNSLGVRYKGKISGWIITNRVDKDTLRYSSFYVVPEFRNTFVPIILLMQSILLQLNSTIENAIVEFNLAQIEHKWIAFAKKRLAPHTESIERFYEVSFCTPLC